MLASDLRAALAQPWVHGQAVDFRGKRIDGTLDLSGLALGGFDLRGCHFSDDVLAQGARFDGLSWFGGATFSGKFDLTSALFLNDARFEDCQFNGPAALSQAEFHGIARLDRAQFAQAAALDHLTCYGNLSLDQTHFANGADFTGSECLGGFWANDTHFGAGSDFSDTQIHGRLWLRGAQDGNADLHSARFGLSFGYTYR